MTYIKLFPTISDQFRTRQTDWRDRREQATPVLNKILDDLEKKENWTQQRSFLTDAVILESFRKDYE